MAFRLSDAFEFVNYQVFFPLTRCLSSRYRVNKTFPFSKTDLEILFDKMFFSLSMRGSPFLKFFISVALKSFENSKQFERSSER